MSHSYRWISILFFLLVMATAFTLTVSTRLFTKVYAETSAPAESGNNDQIGATCIALTAPADIPSATLIQFEDLAVNTVIANHYKPTFGVSFENTATKSSQVMTFTDGISTTQVAVSVVTPTVSSNDRRLLIQFDQKQSHVGMLVGNGDPQMSVPLAILIAYDAQGAEICRTSKGPVSTTTLSPFIGIRDPFGNIRMVGIVYQDSERAVTIDDLRFTYNAQSITPTPTNTATPTKTPTATYTRTPTPTRTPFPLVAPTPVPFWWHSPQDLQVAPVVNDIFLYGIEVTQGIQCFDTSEGLKDQCPNNSLILVGNKPSVVRVYVGYKGETFGQPVPVSVQIQLCGSFLPNTEECEGNDFTAIATKSMQRTDSKLSAEANFLLQFNGSDPFTLTVSARADSNNKYQEQDESNNSIGNVKVVYRNVEPIKIFAKRIRYHEAGKTYDAKGHAVSGDAAKWLNNIMPLQIGSVVYQLGSGFLDLYAPFYSQFDHSIEKDNLAYIEYHAIEEEAQNGQDNILTYYYGWIPDYAYPGAGIAFNTVYFTSMGTDRAGAQPGSSDSPAWGSKVFAHEMAHVWGLDHIGLPDSCGSVKYTGNGDIWKDYPSYYTDSSIQELGINPSTHRIYNPADTHDLMSYCGIQGRNGINHARLSPFAWDTMRKHFQVSNTNARAGRSFNPGQAQAQPAFHSVDTAQVLALSIAITNPQVASDSGAFRKVSLFPGSRVLPPAIAEGEYAVQLRMAGTAVYTQPFFVNFHAHTSTITSSVTTTSTGEENDELARDVTNFVIPWIEGADTVVLLHHDTLLDQRQISKNPPVVTITHPITAQTWAAGSQQSLTWEGSDEDATPLVYTLQFNRDGTRWETVGIGITATTFTLAVDDFAGGLATRFRVLANDGLYTTISAESVPVTLPSHLPELKLIAPLSGTTQLPGTSVILTGYAFDMEDGLINHTSAYQWSSDLQGPLGAGTDIVFNGLQNGWHTITLSVKDQDGNQVSQSVKVFIGKQLFLPIISK